MADTMRWRYGDTNPVVAPVDSATVIEIGDLVYLDTDDAKPAGYDANGDGFPDALKSPTAHTAFERGQASSSTKYAVTTSSNWCFEIGHPRSSKSTGT